MHDEEERLKAIDAHAKLAWASRRLGDVDVNEKDESVASPSSSSSSLSLESSTASTEPCTSMLFHYNTHLIAAVSIVAFVIGALFGKSFRAERSTPPTSTNNNDGGQRVINVTPVQSSDGISYTAI
jgi:hypothetical protein